MTPRLTNKGLLAFATFLSVFFVLVSQSASSAAPGDESAPATVELTSLLNNFLAGVSRNDVAVQDRFWADDLIYTASAGRRIDKPTLMQEVRAEAAAPPTDEKTTYRAEDIRIHQYGTTAIVAFRLIATTQKGDQTKGANYLNTGTFLQRDGKWQAVSWQATKIPAEVKK